MSGARQGRRRRILQEEVLSASREMSAYSPDSTNDPEGGEGRRYAFDEGSLGDALARRHFPSGGLAPAGLLVAGVASVVALAALHEYNGVIAAHLGESTQMLFDAARPTSLATWLASATMLVVAILSIMILAVRRRRVDDYRGGHRFWRGAIAAALLLSIDAVTNLHSVAGAALSKATGIELMSGGAEWWLGAGVVLFGWVGLRVLLDVKESKWALATLLVAIVAGGVAIVGPMAGIGGASSTVVAKLAQVTCYSFVAASLVGYMRFLRADVAAGVAVKPQKSRPAEVKIAKGTAATKAKAADDQDSEIASDSQTAGRKAKPAKVADQSEPEEARWTDGSDGYAENYDDEGAPRKLSKSERKRLRQQKTTRRAA